MIDVPHVVGVLTSWTAPDLEQSVLRGQYLEFLAAHPDGIWRSCRPGHVTASCLVMNQDRDEVLLTLHPKVGRWLQLGGHCERIDETLQRASAREVVEESGLLPTWISEEPLRLDRHPVPCGGQASEHLDVQYLALVGAQRDPVCSAESLDLRWFPVTALPQDLDASVHALIAAARS